MMWTDVYLKFIVSSLHYCYRIINSFDTYNFQTVFWDICVQVPHLKLVSLVYVPDLSFIRPEKNGQVYKVEQEPCVSVKTGLVSYTCVCRGKERWTKGFRINSCLYSLLIINRPLCSSKQKYLNRLFRRDRCGSKTPKSRGFVVNTQSSMVVEITLSFPKHVLNTWRTLTRYKIFKKKESEKKRHVPQIITWKSLSRRPSCADRERRWMTRVLVACYSFVRKQSLYTPNQSERCPNDRRSGR